MENEIDNEYIEKAINELIKFFGIKESFKEKDIFKKISNGEIKEAVKLVAYQLGLPIDINIINVPSDYTAQNIDNRFQTKHVIKIHKDRLDDQNNFGVGGIIAQVFIPENLPIYGSSTFNNYPINVKISDNCIEYPKAFIVIIAHELSHVLMHSLRHPERENEFYTDILAMILGFNDIFKDGRKIITTKKSNDFLNPTTTATITYGYLNDKQFSFAYKNIKSILEKNQQKKRLLLKELKSLNNLLSEFDKNIFRFRRFLEYLTKNKTKKINIEDTKKIVEFFNQGYIINFDLIIKKYKTESKKIENFSKEISHYNEQIINKIIFYTENLKDYQNELKDKIFSLKKDIKILSKYVDLKYKIKVFFSSFFTP